METAAHKHEQHDRPEILRSLSKAIPLKNDPFMLRQAQHERKTVNAIPVIPVRPEPFDKPAVRPELCRRMRLVSQHRLRRRVNKGFSAESKAAQGPGKKGSRIPPLHVAMVSPEVGLFAKTGGLADMVGALSTALERLGLKISVIMPAYRSVLRGNHSFTETGLKITVPISDRQEDGTVLKTTMGQNISVYFIRSDLYFDRDHLYGTRDGDYPDNSERFVFFARAALEVLRRDPPEILHCHDWQSALAVVFLRAQTELYPELSSVKTFLTVHNLGYQGLFSHLDWHLLNLDRHFFTPRYLEFHGKINFLKGGLVFSDALTTVSRTYAEEIKTQEEGFGLEGVFQECAQKLTGILNGADYSQWNPETDPSIARNYGPNDLSGKKICKLVLQRIFGLPEEPETPVVGMVSRLTSQKGFNLMATALDELFRREIQFVLLGSGEKKYEDFFTAGIARHPEHGAIKIGFDETLAHRIEAGADLFLMPSLYEPCGLNQLYSLKYGTIPVVRATGGLKDSVEEYDPKGGRGTGFLFGPFEERALLETLDRALNLYRKKTQWTGLVKRAMAADFSWDRSARAYCDLYQRLGSPVRSSGGNP